MPAVSKAQQHLMGMVHAAQKGEEPASPEVAKIAKTIDPKAAKDYASTKTKDLPTHKLKEAVRKIYRESLRESVLIEKQLKGITNIPSNVLLSKATHDQKLGIIKASGNIIDFKVPSYAKDRNFWQVISSGTIKNKDGKYFLSGRGLLSSPVFTSVDDLINGVDWDSMEQTRRFNESLR